MNRPLDKLIVTVTKTADGSAEYMQVVSSDQIDLRDARPAVKKGKPK